MMEIFNCQKCGQCCMGKGGIVLTRKDIKRLCDGLKMEEEEFMPRYASEKAGKHYLAVTTANECIFFNKENGCQVHEFKPDICRAWPFFRGNLLDEISLDMAKNYCPGIAKDCGFQHFRHVGLQYLKENNLIHADHDSPEALKVLDII